MASILLFRWSMMIFVASCSCMLLLLLSSTWAMAAGVPAVYVFGDSLVDVGNNDYLDFSLIKADFAHNGVDYQGGTATGRFSNGKNSADFLAEKLGRPTSPPYLSIPADTNQTQAFLAGVSFASAGAGILDTTNADQCLTMSKQVDYFSTVYTDLVQQLGISQAERHLSKSIFAFVIGSNDILVYIESNSSSEYQLETTPQDLVNSMITSLQGQLKSLYNFGARKFALVGTGLVGCCPARRDKTSGVCNAEGNNISSRFDSAAATLLLEMKSEHSDMNYSVFNSSVRFSELLQNPSTYGFTEVKDACCGLGNRNAKFACIPVSSLCPNRSNHLFWDFYHPSERTAGLLTTTFFEGSPPYVYPVNVKQLSTL